MNWLKADARNRAWRTVLQTLVLTVLAPAGDAALQAVQRALVDSAGGAPLDWSRVGQTALYAAGSGVALSLIAYLHRVKADPSVLPSAQPPAPPGAVRQFVTLPASTRKAARWRWGFLGVTALAIAMEVFAAFDGDPETDPWTDMIVRWLPGEVTALAIAGLSGWLAVHFGLRYWRKHRGGRDAG